MRVLEWIVAAVVFAAVYVAVAVLAMLPYALIAVFVIEFLRLVGVI